MARPLLPLGQHGRVKRTEIAQGVWVAKARVRDFDGVTRLVERRTPVGVDDRYGAGAERELLAAIGDRTSPGADDLGSESLISLLWEVYRAHLVDQERTLRTLDRYDYVAVKITSAFGNVCIREATTQKLNKFIQAVKENNGPSVAKTAKVLLSGMFGLAVQYGAATINPVREVSRVSAKAKSARALTPDDLQALLRGVMTSRRLLPAMPGAARSSTTTTISGYCRDADLADPVVMFAATGCRISELLGLRWSDVDLMAGTVSITGKVIRAKGRGLIRENTTKTEAGERVLPLPPFAVAMLLRRQVGAEPNPHDVVFPSEVGTLRDPDGMSRQWRRVRDALGFEWVVTHSFRKTLATMIDAAGLSARVGADHLGHRQVSMTQNVYMGRGQVHREVASVVQGVAGAAVSWDQSVG